ncbi:hypothetical protein [Streptomyces sp. IB201691-2A2]|uniref:hypothetical protein n=1 Tax=Streptomyces sp. IB201691-2A2 TaxID=2561920 RepID=UPI0011811524|nr:hypothetical protein [Streptomyces sp. IB201691-2A2]TRO56024.1 hypothetical protein E4K73_48310 [Streptomyces sp. IB201691-2A2]
MKYNALPVEELAGTFSPGADADFILGVIAWGASAAGVAGLIITGTVLALQWRSGEMGEHASYMRGLFYVFAGCVIATTAGPIVQFLGPLTL